MPSDSDWLDLPAELAREAAGRCAAELSAVRGYLVHGTPQVDPESPTIRDIDAAIRLVHPDYDPR